MRLEVVAPGLGHLGAGLLEVLPRDRGDPTVVVHQNPVRDHQTDPGAAYPRQLRDPLGKLVFGEQAGNGRVRQQDELTQQVGGGRDDREHHVVTVTNQVHPHHGPGPGGQGGQHTVLVGSDSHHDVSLGGQPVGDEVVLAADPPGDQAAGRPSLQHPSRQGARALKTQVLGNLR